MLFLAFLLCLVVAGVSGERKEKEFTVFNVVRFPNDVCTSQSNLNGTCYTASECTNLGGSASGSCASSFGVCCVFNIACGATTSANNSYATINSFSTTTDSDPCIYKYCKTNDDVWTDRNEESSEPATWDRGTVGSSSSVNSFYDVNTENSVTSFRSFNQ